MPAGALPVRTVAHEYSGTAGVSGVGSAGWRTTPHRVGEAGAGLRRGERTADVRAEDASGLPVPFSLYQDLDGDGTTETFFGWFCGRTPAPVRLEADRGRVDVFVLAGTCGSTAGAGTTGTVTFRLA